MPSTEAEPDGTYLSVILYYLTFELPFVVFMMRGYFSRPPRTSRRPPGSDGCSRLAAFRRIMLPLAIPGPFHGNDPCVHPVVG